MTLTAGSPARASDVMSNFNSTTNCVNANAAKNGANSDITSLSGLTTPLSPAQGGTATYVAAVSSTAANTYVSNSMTPDSYTLSTSKVIRWLAPATNTASATFDPGGGIGATTLYKIVRGAAVALIGGEIQDTNVYGLAYNGSNLLLLNPSPIPVRTCVILTTAAGTCANGGTEANNGTYTTPVGALYVTVEAVGGGGGGGGGNNGAAATNGGNTTFGALTAGGGGGSAATGSGSGGSASGADMTATGSVGTCGSYSRNADMFGTGGVGGISPFGGNGAGSPSNNGSAAPANSGGGGGGGGANASVTISSGCGGAAGGYLRHQYNSPAATYTYAIGAGGAGAAGSGAAGFAGAAGGSGRIIVRAFFQ